MQAAWGGYERQITRRDAACVQAPRWKGSRHRGTRRCAAWSAQRRCDGVATRPRRRKRNKCKVLRGTKEATRQGAGEGAGGDGIEKQKRAQRSRTGALVPPRVRGWEREGREREPANEKRHARSDGNAHCALETVEEKIKASVDEETIHWARQGGPKGRREERRKECMPA